MSTRSVIARPNGDGFAGVYAHWDGYPTCRGAQLWETYQELGQSIEALRGYAIREGQEGYWSSYQTPSRLIEEAQKPDKVPCNLCEATGTRTDGVIAIKPGNCNGCGGTGQRDNFEKSGGFGGTGENWVTSEGDDMGTEWAYVLADKAMTIFERRFGNPSEDLGHGTGMFGMGASDTEVGGYWALVATCPWDGGEPDWEAIEASCQEPADAE